MVELLLLRFLCWDAGRSSSHKVIAARGSPVPLNDGAFNPVPVITAIAESGRAVRFVIAAGEIRSNPRPLARQTPGIATAKRAAKKATPHIDPRSHFLGVANTSSRDENCFMLIS